MVHCVKVVKAASMVWFPPAVLRQLAKSPGRDMDALAGGAIFRNQLSVTPLGITVPNDTSGVLS